MNKRMAVMDLGTNTFHLLIAEKAENGFKEILHLTEAVKLGEGGMKDGLIKADAFERGLKTMELFAEKIRLKEASEIRAVATSAIRSTTNGNDFIQKVKERAGIEIEVIDGLKEAGLIYKGVKSSGILSAEKAMILDIGGGSVEFILCDNQKIYWKQSFEIGAQRLRQLFHQVDPMTAENVTKLNQYLEEQLQMLFLSVKKQDVQHLIGSSGSFETYTEMIEVEKGDQFNIKNIKTYNFKIDDFNEVANWLQHSSHQERLAKRSIIPLRVDMIVVASLITSFIMQKLEIQKLSMTTYSLKEGVLAEMMEVQGMSN
ncbi:Ppx/GppA phosphatase family protein [Mucilaginibacter arboris]|uniref:Exopolyphosphatase n=1 Tax=Mucilaginibacter arboris TaxID=2682090 RepID=A0A7K1SSX7_9SPHI|nr:exopolyphosphatase [Mucilaginibacter arboris]MVN20354.1 exopolyphosphatase [Mucilaginibacter arboris]